MESGFLKTLNEQQEAALTELGEKTKDIAFVKNHPDGDAYLLRFLRATMEDKVCFMATVASFRIRRICPEKDCVC